MPAIFIVGTDGTIGLSDFGFTKASLNAIAAIRSPKPTMACRQAVLADGRRVSVRETLNGWLEHEIARLKVKTGNRNSLTSVNCGLVVFLCNRCRRGSMVRHRGEDPGFHFRSPCKSRRCRCRSGGWLRQWLGVAWSRFVSGPAGRASRFPGSIGRSSHRFSIRARWLACGQVVTWPVRPSFFREYPCISLISGAHLAAASPAATPWAVSEHLF